MKTFRLLRIFFMWGCAAHCASQQPIIDREIFEKKSSERLTLDLPSMNRIQNKIEIFKKEIKRSRLYRRGTYGTLAFVGGMAACYVGVNLYSDWFKSHDATALNNVDGAVTNKHIDDHLREECRKDFEERRSFWGRIKRNMLDGAHFGIYSALVGAVVKAFTYFEGLTLTKIRSLINKNEATMFNDLFIHMWRRVDLLENSLFTVIKDLEFLLSHHTESREEQFKEFFSTQLMVDYRSLVDATENILALTMICLENQSDHEDRTLVEDAMMHMIDTVSDFSFYLEELLNTSGSFDPVTSRYEATVLFKKFSVNIARVIGVFMRSFDFKVDEDV